MKIIDFSRKGNVIRFYLGEKTEDWGWTNSEWKGYDGKGRPDYVKPSDIYYGDDWDDAPYEHNAGTVYDQFIKGHKDIVVAFDDLVFEPSDGEFNSQWCKEDMVARKVPCIVVVPKEVWSKDGDSWGYGFTSAAMSDEAVKYYFGDEMEPDLD